MVTNHRSHFGFTKRLFLSDNFFPIHDKSNIFKLNTFSNITGQALDQDLVPRFNPHLLTTGLYYCIHSTNLPDAPNYALVLKINHFPNFRS